MTWPPDMDTGDARDDELRNLRTANWLLRQEVERLCKQLAVEAMQQQMKQFVTSMARFDIG